MELSVFGVGFTNRQSACFFIFGGLQPLCTAGCSSFDFNRPIPSLTRFYATGAHCCPVKYICGGPRFPNTSMVMSVPVLQHGHLRSIVFIFISGLGACTLNCKACNFPRFQLLLSMP